MQLFASSDPFGDDDVDFDLDPMLTAAYNNAVECLKDSRRPLVATLPNGMDNPLLECKVSISLVYANPSPPQSTQHGGCTLGQSCSSYLSAAKLGRFASIVASMRQAKAAHAATHAHAVQADVNRYQCARLLTNTSANLLYRSLESCHYYNSLTSCCIWHQQIPLAYTCLARQMAMKLVQNGIEVPPPKSPKQSEKVSKSFKSVASASHVASTIAKKPQITWLEPKSG